MKKLLMIFMIGMTLVLTGCSGTKENTTEQTSEISLQTEEVTTSKPEQQSSEETENHTQESRQKEEQVFMNVKIGDKAYQAILSDNSSVDALVELLKKGPLTIDMHDYGNFEKVGEIGQTLPRNDESITTGPGDIILYQGSNLVLYYDTNTWDFTSIGKIPNVTTDELLDVLGKGNVTVEFSLSK